LRRTLHLSNRDRASPASKEQTLSPANLSQQEVLPLTQCFVVYEAPSKSRHHTVGLMNCSYLALALLSKGFIVLRSRSRTLRYVVGKSGMLWFVLASWRADNPACELQTSLLATRTLSFYILSYISPTTTEFAMMNLTAPQV
jgi:hypothetical protein